MYDLIVRNLKFPSDPSLKDIGIEDGQIKEIGKISASGKKEVDAYGDLVLAPFVESHIHLDTVLTAGTPQWNESGTLFEGIQIWGERKKKLTINDVKSRALEVLRNQLSYGILHVRSHVDISDPNLTALLALLEIKEEISPYINLQIVAFPQDGILSNRGNQQRLEEALRLGADAVGAIPHNEYTRENGVESLKICFLLAEKYNRMVNVFCDETDDGQSRFLEVVAMLALQMGLKQKVTASHANAMAHYPAPYVARLIGLLKEAEINIVSCPLVSSVMQERYDAWPKGRGITRIKELWKSGINVSIGHDDILTPFYPFGTGSMLQAAHMAIHLAQMTGKQEVEEIINMVTIRGAKTLQIESQYGIEEGKPASFVTLPAMDSFDLIRHQPMCRYVFSHGKIISENKFSTPRLNMDGILK
ncbi:cytosine deaminase [Neobacillus mesonae]|uniref:Cytosine deaminase n=1 Tax=Neobacillus mesonae TaxID=1193713 RepID=A0A3Q9QUX4_9BACI|nr:cytosine deaminase [Neobacillus mesonae]AZU62132.1 cytosine deaminase [Neobacillus mesonae]